jgi:hypothetical protein
MGLRMQSWRVQKPQEVTGVRGRFWRLAAVFLTAEGILALWVLDRAGQICVFHPLGCG